MDLDELIRQGKVKRIFRAKRKLTLPNLVSHITQRAAGKDPLFIEDSDYLFMLANLKDISKKRFLDVFAFCLIPNHIHLLVSPRKDELHQPMRDLFSRYAMWFNKKYQRKGHLFAGPYRQSVCMDDAYLLAASLYIHMNPARAGLINDPMGYRWSSINLYHNQNAPSSFVKPGFVLGLLSKDGNMQKKVYTGLLEKSISLVEEDVIEHTNAVQKFKKALVRVFPSVFSGVENSKQISQYTGLDLLDERQLDQRIRALKAGSPAISPESRKARRFLIEQLIARGYKRDEIAARLGMSVKTVYNILKATG
jgi:putative transposase